MKKSDCCNPLKPDFNKCELLLLTGLEINADLRNKKQRSKQNKKPVLVQYCKNNKLFVSLQ